MKWLFIAVFIFFVFVSCQGIQIDKHQSAIYGIETSAVVIGYYAAQQPDVDLTLRSLYDVATKGQLTAKGVNKILLRLNVTNQFEMVMIRRVLRLAEMIGASVIDGQIVDVAGIPPEFINAIGRGYVEGFDTYQLKLK